MDLSSCLSWVWVGVTSTFRVMSSSVLTYSDLTKDKSLFQEGKSEGNKEGESKLSE